jgi:hypothetical protein
VALALFVGSDCKVAVTVTVLGDGKLAGATNVALLPLGVRVPIAGFSLQVTLRTPPLGLDAVNPWDAPKATTPDVGDTERPAAGVGVGVAVPDLELPPPQPIKIRKSPHAHIALRIVMTFTPHSPAGQFALGVRSKKF